MTNPFHFERSEGSDMCDGCFSSDFFLFPMLQLVLHNRTRSLRAAGRMTTKILFLIFELRAGPKSVAVCDCGGDGRSVYHADSLLFLIGGVIPAPCDCASIARIPISKDFFCYFSFSERKVVTKTN